MILNTDLQVCFCVPHIIIVVLSFLHFYCTQRRQKVYNMFLVMNTLECLCRLVECTMYCLICKRFCKWLRHIENHITIVKF